MSFPLYKSHQQRDALYNVYTIYPFKGDFIWHQHNNVILDRIEWIYNSYFKYFTPVLLFDDYILFEKFSFEYLNIRENLYQNI